MAEEQASIKLGQRNLSFFDLKIQRSLFMQLCISFTIQSQEI